MPEATPVLVSMMSWLCLVQSSQIQLIQRLECFLDCSPQGKILLMCLSKNTCSGVLWTEDTTGIDSVPAPSRPHSHPHAFCCFWRLFPHFPRVFVSKSLNLREVLGVHVPLADNWKSWEYESPASSLAQHQRWEVSYTLAGSGLSHPRGLYLKPPSCLVSCLLPIPDHLPLEHPLHTSLHTNPLRDVTEDTRRKPARPGGLWAPPESKGQGSLEVISTNPQKTPRSTQAVTSPLHPGSHRPESKLALEYPAPGLWYGKGNQPGSLLEKKEGRGDKGLSGTRSFLPTPSPGLKVSLHDALRSLHSAPSPSSDHTTSGSCSGPVPWDSNKQLSRPVLDGPHHALCQDHTWGPPVSSAPGDTGSQSWLSSSFAATR